MADWVRWCSEQGSAPAGVRELLQVAAAPAPMPAASHARALGYATKLASGKAVGALSLVAGKVLAGGLVVGTTCAVAALAVGQRSPTVTVLAPAGPGESRAAPARVAPTHESIDTPRMVDGAREDSPSLADAPAEPPKAKLGIASEPRPHPGERAEPYRGARPVPLAESSKTAAPKTAAPDRTLAEETALLERARQALAADPALALRLSQTHSERFPHGQLLPASRVVAIEALRRLGRDDEARTRARRFVETQPDGLYSERVRELIPTK